MIATIDKDAADAPPPASSVSTSLSASVSAPAYSDGESNGKNKKENANLSLQRKLSLSEQERFFLSAFLVDKDSNAPSSSASTHSPSRVSSKELSDSVLFSVPCDEESGRSLFHDKSSLTDDEEQASVDKKDPPLPPKCKRDSFFHNGLWKAHHDGLGVNAIRNFFKRLEFLTPVSSSESEGDPKRHSRNTSRTSGARNMYSQTEAESRKYGSKSSRTSTARKSKTSSEKGQRNAVEIDKSNIPSDDEVDPTTYIGDYDDQRSWSSSEGGFEHFDAWSVLKDEYAADFGFSYRDGKEGSRFLNDGTDDNCRQFRILGTSADDMSSHPHVLSPPLIESLLNFVPESCCGSNLWMKYSLVRDGACLKTLRRYCRAAEVTVIAVETTKGHVFGSFTSSPWKRMNGYYGSGEAFLWKMRSSRHFPVHSMIEQAEIESDIDVYPFSGNNSYIQLCLNDKIAIGGGALDTSGSKTTASGSIHLEDLEEKPNVYELESGHDFGFGLAIGEDLLSGTSTPCSTFRNPCLCNPNTKMGDAFQVVNLEVWTFTPCETVETAQKLELSKYFQRRCREEKEPREESQHSGLSGEDLSVERFYRRVGEEECHQLGADIAIGTAAMRNLMST